MLGSTYLFYVGHINVTGLLCRKTLDYSE